MYDKGWEGHLGWFESRQEKLKELIINLYPTNLIEIGFNMGHSCKLICDTISELKDNNDNYARREVNFYVFDIGYYGCVESNFNILQEYYQSKNIKLYLIMGASENTIKPFLNEVGDIFDFIEIDGSHTADGVYGDIMNTYKMIKSGGVIYVDDYKSTEIPCPQVDESVDKIDWSEYDINNIDGVFWGIRK
jgi:hypothetical protein